jgi:hypothetical protein
MSADLRKHMRRPLDIRAYVETLTEVSVADVSETGAKLVVKDPASLPDEFLIRLRADLKKWCRVRWRGADEVGIEFIAPPDLKS